MGGGSWTASDWKSYSSSKISGKSSATAIYTSSGMKSEYDPKNVLVRESCDSLEHPNSIPIIIGLDVTGSMGSILKVVAERLSDTVTGIINRQPVTDPQIMFNAIGDSDWGGDTAPLQVTQFESDIRIAKQLTDLYFEMGGGGNAFESYPLTWYFAANKTKIDSYDKHKRKGFIFTMGDDGFPEYIKKREIKYVFGEDVGEDINVRALLNQVNRKWEVFHLCIQQGGSYNDGQLEDWRGLLGERAIKIVDYNKIPEIIISLLEAISGKSTSDIISSWDGSTSLAVKEALSGLSTRSNTKEELVEF